MCVCPTFTEYSTCTHPSPSSGLLDKSSSRFSSFTSYRHPLFSLDLHRHLVALLVPYLNTLISSGTFPPGISSDPLLHIHTTTPVGSDICSPAPLDHFHTLGWVGVYFHLESPAYIGNLESCPISLAHYWPAVYHQYYVRNLIASSSCHPLTSSLQTDTPRGRIRSAILVASVN